jgi:hypothetical protein
MRPVAMASSRNNSRNASLFTPIPTSNNRECIAFAQSAASLLCSSLMKFPPRARWPMVRQVLGRATTNLKLLLSPQQSRETFPGGLDNTPASTRLALPGDNFRHASGKIFSGRRMSGPHLIPRLTFWVGMLLRQRTCTRAMKVFAQARAHFLLGNAS